MEEAENQERLAQAAKRGIIQPHSQPTGVDVLVQARRVAYSSASDRSELSAADFVRVAASELDAARCANRLEKLCALRAPRTWCGLSE